MTVQPLSRRSLLTGSVLTVAAGIVGYAVARNSDAASAGSPTAAANGYGPSSGGATVLAPVSKVIGDGIVAGGVVLTVDASGAVHGVSATCTHQGCTVAPPHNGTVSCPCHGSQFDAVTGKVLRGPATRPLPAIAVRQQGDQVVRG
jgi:Rieske Fe-S protein